MPCKSSPELLVCENFVSYRVEVFCNPTVSIKEASDKATLFVVNPRLLTLLSFKL